MAQTEEPDYLPCDDYRFCDATEEFLAEHAFPASIEFRRPALRDPAHWRPRRSGHRAVHHRLD
jgi:hypothetical protein